VTREHSLPFGSGMLADGRPAFFHPDRLTLGQPLYLSDVISVVMSIAGVRWAETREFRRLLAAPPGDLDRGVIEAGRVEVLRCDSDPNAPENGSIDFEVEGGS
jgi:hypothetical protein